jgi:hypothetical protein
MPLTARCGTPAGRVGLLIVLALKPLDAPLLLCEDLRDHAQNSTA